MTNELVIQTLKLSQTNSQVINDFSFHNKLFDGVSVLLTHVK